MYILLDCIPIKMILITAQVKKKLKLRFWGTFGGFFGKSRPRVWKVILHNLGLTMEF